MVSINRERKIWGKEKVYIYTNHQCRSTRAKESVGIRLQEPFSLALKWLKLIQILGTYSENLLVESEHWNDTDEGLQGLVTSPFHLLTYEDLGMVSIKRT